MHVRRAAGPGGAVGKAGGRMAETGATRAAGRKALAAGVASLQALQDSADASPRVGYLQALRAGAGARAAVQRAKKKHGTSNAHYYTTAGEARAHMLRYAEQLGVTPGESVLQQAIEQAMDGKNWGIEQAERLIFGLKQEEDERRRRAERAQAIKDDADQIETQLTDALALQAFRLARTLYVGGKEVNATVGGPETEDAFLDALADWEMMADAGVVTNFHGFEPQDKAASGKGNVGATLATRGVQGNLLCYFQGVKINIHVDIT